MKKTLILMALLGGMTAQAESIAVFTDGYNLDNYRDAYDYAMVGKMCWGANASNVISWWQDELVKQGYNLPQGTPTQTDVFAEYRAGLNEYKGGYPDSALEWWLDGYYYGTQNNDPEHTGAFYSELLQPMEHNNYNNTDSMIKQFFPATYGTRENLSRAIVDTLRGGYALIVDIGSTSVTVWGADYDTDSGLLTSVYYSDPHWPSQVWHGTLSNDTDVMEYETFYIAGTGTIAAITGLSCHIEDYLTEAAYTDTGSGAFAPTYNVKLDSGSTYTLNKEMKAAAADNGLHGKANADVTITNGTVKVEDNGSTEGAVIFAQGDESASRKLSVQRTGLVLSEVQVNAASGNTLEVTAGNDVTITTTTGEGSLVKTGEGTLVNGGTLGNIELKEGTLKGSGKFGSVIIDGGTLVVGNSPGHQDYEGALTLNSGSLVFSVAGFDESKTLTSTGWDSDTYSTIDMHGNAFTADGGEIVIALSDEAANSLTMGGGEYALALVTGMSNELSQDQLASLAERTKFQLTDEANATALNTPDFAYKMSGNALILTAGVGDNGNVPEPATGTLSLLALAGLMSRRRRK